MDGNIDHWSHKELSGENQLFVFCAFASFYAHLMLCLCIFTLWTLGLKCTVVALAC
jgi:hypothetical protein